MQNFKELMKSKKIGFIIFGRMSSKRYPGKVLKKIYKKKNIFELIFENFKLDNLHTKIIVATSKKKIDYKIVNFCIKNKINIFQGSHDNVFLRTRQCIKKYDLDYFVRICADRPFFDVPMMKKMIKLFFLKKVDIATNAFPRTYPKGLTCEIAKANIFKKVNVKSLSKTEKEHIFNYFYKKKNYKIFSFKKKFEKNFLSKNFSFDDKKDLIKIKKIFSMLSKENKKITTNNLYKLYLKKFI
jgi:spore coat polysaccharide biosynthesis protein SpsF